jgi:4-hydroxy-tetrahydrodipicolinate synthase
MSNSVNSVGHFGLGCAIATPVMRDGAVDLARFTAHARQCLDNGCDSLTLFGTTGEGPSFGLAPRQQAFNAFIQAGIAPAEKLLSGVMALSEEDALAQSELALQVGCSGLLLAPPSYFRGVDDTALAEWFSRILVPLTGRTRIYLYHIPGMTGVPLSVDLVGQLKSRFPGLVAGVKDSSGDWNNTSALLESHRDLQILVGDERLLARAVRAGGSGTICGIANVAPQILVRAAHKGEDDARISPLVEAALQYPIIPAVKALIARRYGDPGWLQTRAPLPPLNNSDADQLGNAMDRLLSPTMAA